MLLILIQVLIYFQLSSMKKKVFNVVCKIVEYTIYAAGLAAFEYALYKCYTGC